MRRFILGIIVAVILIVVGGYLYMRSGAVDLTALTAPGSFERKAANSMLDHFVDAHAPNVKNPQAPTPENLAAGAREWEEHCTLCHGSPYANGLNLGAFLSPRAPQLMKKPMHDPDANIYFVIKNGIRWTGMPGWGKHMEDDDIWNVVTLLKNPTNLPPQVVEQWKQFAAPNNSPHMTHEEGKEEEKENTRQPTPIPLDKHKH